MGSLEVHPLNHVRKHVKALFTHQQSGRLHLKLEARKEARKEGREPSQARCAGKAVKASTASKPAVLPPYLECLLSKVLQHLVSAVPDRQ